MRKLIVSMNLTLDGFLSGPDCELDWHFNYWNDEMADYAGQQLSLADTILLGRVTYTAMSKYWPARSQQLWSPRQDLAFTEMMNSYRKIVFSRTLQTATWCNSVIEAGNLSSSVPALKKQDGRDMIVYGSAKVVGSLIELSLVDEFQLWIHPVTIGRGKPLFAITNRRSPLALRKTRTFQSGVIVLHYEPVSIAKGTVNDEPPLSSRSLAI